MIGLRLVLIINIKFINSLFIKLYDILINYIYINYILYITDVTKSVALLGLNELIEEFVDKAKNILLQSHIKNYRNGEYIYHKVIDSPAEFKENCLNSNDFQFQTEMWEHVIGGLKKFDNFQYDDVFNSIKDAIIYILIIFGIGGLLVNGSFIMYYRSIIITNRILNELVNIIFLIPPNTINMVPQFKRFVETASFEEE